MRSSVAPTDQAPSAKTAAEGPNETIHYIFGIGESQKRQIFWKNTISAKTPHFFGAVTGRYGFGELLNGTTC